MVWCGHIGGLISLVRGLVILHCYVLSLRPVLPAHSSSDEHISNAIREREYKSKPGHSVLIVLWRFVSAFVPRTSYQLLILVIVCSRFILDFSRSGSGIAPGNASALSRSYEGQTSILYPTKHLTATAERPYIKVFQAKS